MFHPPDQPSLLVMHSRFQWVNSLFIARPYRCLVDAAIKCNDSIYTHFPCAILHCPLFPYPIPSPTMWRKSNSTWNQRLPAPNCKQFQMQNQSKSKSDCDKKNVEEKKKRKNV